MAPLNCLTQARMSPELDVLRSSLVPVPSPHVASFQLLTTDPEKAIAATAHAQSSKRNLKELVAEDWERRHALVMQGDSRPLLAEHAEPESLCMKAGMCLCCAQGQRRRQFTERFVRALKRAVPHQTPLRASARDGFLLCHFRSFPGLALPLQQRGEREREPSTDHWLHLGLLFLKPFRATFMGMKLASAEGEGEPGHPLLVVVEAASTFYTQYEAMCLLALEDGWEVQFYWLENTDRPIASFFPGRVSAKQREQEADVFWPVLRRRRRVAGAL